MDKENSERFFTCWSSSNLLIKGPAMCKTKYVHVCVCVYWMWEVDNFRVSLACKKKNLFLFHIFCFYFIFSLTITKIVTLALCVSYLQIFDIWEKKNIDIFHFKFSQIITEILLCLHFTISYFQKLVQETIKTKQSQNNMTFL